MKGRSSVSYISQFFVKHLFRLLIKSILVQNSVNNKEEKRIQKMRFTKTFGSPVRSSTHANIKSESPTFSLL